MGKKAITIIMTVTVVAALFSFGSLVALRPGTEGGFLSELFPESVPEEVQEEITAEDILAELTGSDELRNLVNTEVANKINEVALEGADVDIELLREQIYAEVSEALLESQMQAMEALEVEAEEIRAENRALGVTLADLQSEIEALKVSQAADAEELAALRTEQEATDSEIAALEERLKADTAAIIDTKIEELKSLFASADKAVFDALIDELVLLEDDIYAYIDSELERRIAELSIMPIEGDEPELSVEALAEIFAENILAASRSNTGDTVYDEIVYNVASDVMAMLAQEDAKAFGELTEYRDASYDVIEMVVNEILDRLAGIGSAGTYSLVDEEEGTVEETVEPVAEETEEPVAEETVEEVAEPVEEVPAAETGETVTEPAPEVEKTPLISRPGFSFDDTTMDTTRTEARDAAINSVIDALKKNSGN